MLQADFWNNKTDSKLVIKEKKLFEDLINSFHNSIKNLKDLDELSKLAIEENNLIVQSEILENIKSLREEVKKNEIKCFLSKNTDL